MIGLRGYYAILDVRPAAAQAGPAAADGNRVGVVAGAALGATDDGEVWPAVEAVLTRAERLLAAGPCALQLRAKGAGAAVLLTLARALQPLARAAAVPLCVNDRLDVALAVGAELVHLGQDDLPLLDARRLAAGRLAIGVSTHGEAQAAAAVAGGADYIGFGPVFGTSTKLRPDPTVGLEALARVAATVSVPVVAIGGITLADVGAVARAGAAAAAIIGAVDRAADPTAAGQAIGRAFR